MSLVRSTGEKINKKITAFTSTFTLTEGTVKVNFSNEIETNYFKINSNNIQIKKSGKVRVSANLNAQHQVAGDNVIGIIVKKNNANVISNNSHCGAMRMYYYNSCTISDCELEVQENDIIELFFNTEKQIVIHCDEWGKSYLSLEMI